MDDRSMTVRDTQDWLGANQRHLSLEIAMLRTELTRHAARADGHREPEGGRSEFEALREERRTIQERMPRPPALDDLCARFSLTPFERQLLLLAAAVELDSAFGALCAHAHGDTQRAYPTFGLALAALPDPHWSALLPNAALRYWHLIDFASPGGSPSAPLTSRPLRVDERVLHYLTGLSDLDERLASIVFPAGLDHGLVPTHRDIAAGMVAAWRRHGDRPRPPVMALYGPDPASARAIAAFACGSCGWSPYSINERAISPGANDLHLLVRLWEREVRLDSAALVIDCDGGSSDTHREGALRDLIDRTSGPVVVISRERQQLGRRPTASFEIAKPTAKEQRAIWIAALRDSWESVDGELDGLTSQFSLNVPDIESATEEACAQTGSRPTTSALWNACRRQSRGRLEDLAQRIVSTASLEDLVLPDNQKEILRDVVTHVRHRSTVHDDWGFGGKGSRGLGISALFAGASGTGKTMAAEVLAGALELDLYRVDLSSVVSKYIGETEKNLRRIFDAADSGGVILLFDEADALFGKRSEVKDSHDRYANIEVSYLLQRMECYRGLAILTTNMRSALDVAFLRRIRFIVQFPFPDAAQRAEIWRRVFPRATPIHDLDVDRLSQLNVAGGSIRNVALNAAFLAADTHEPVGMSHVLRAARSEYLKLEKPLTDAEIAGWI
jgi:AAA+ superfamily predicted ATPase